MQRLHINLPDDIHGILQDMCDKEVRNVSKQIQFLIREAHNQASNGSSGEKKQRQNA
tara:strand:+ start:4897 stop:5067 length:171 start_codon:yes stop_codon:yes gene_type:complete